jgi:hypothetical protein
MLPTVVEWSHIEEELLSRKGLLETSKLHVKIRMPEVSSKLPFNKIGVSPVLNDNTTLVESLIGPNRTNVTPKASNSSPKAMYHELKMLLTILAHRNIISPSLPCLQSYHVLRRITFLCLAFAGVVSRMLFERSSSLQFHDIDLNPENVVRSSCGRPRLCNRSS